MTDLSGYEVTGTNNPHKQISVNGWNAFLGDLEDAIEAGSSAESRSVLAALSAAPDQAHYLAETGREGSFVFSTADLSAFVTADSLQGIYVAPTSAPTGASGAWVRKYNGSVNVKWFGATGDGVTDDSAAFVAAIAFLKAIAGNPFSTIYKASPVLFIPAGHYYLGTTTLDITHTLTIQGEGSGFNGNSSATKLRWGAATTGIRLQAYNTSGAGTVDGVAHFSAAGTTIRGVELYGGFVATEGEYHGIHAKVRFGLSDFVISNFAGDGVYIHASAGAGDATEGNANCFRINDGAILSNRDGLSTVGADANAGSIDNVDFSYNRRYGVSEGSFLGNTYRACHTSGNGTSYAAAPFVVVEKSGRWFSVAPSQAVGASTNSPPASATDNTWWIYVKDGNASSFTPTWFNGISVREGAPYGTFGSTGENVFIGCYSESDQPPSRFAYPTAVVGGLQGSGIKGTGAWIRNYQGYTKVGNGTTGLIAEGYSSLSGRLDVAGELIDFNGTTPLIQFRNAGADGGYISSGGGALNINAPAAGGLNLRVNGSNLFHISAVNFYPDADNAMDLGVDAATLRFRTLFAMTGNFGTQVVVGGNKVVGAREAGWAADTGTAKKTATATYSVGSALTVGAAYVQAEHTAIITRQALVEAALRDATQEIKALKDMLITHGLIGT